MSSSSLATYIWNQCTYYVASALSWVPGGLGNANQWLHNAAAKGLPVSSTPAVGDVVVYQGGTSPAALGAPAAQYDSLGHVAVVTGVNPNGTFTVSESNYGGSTQTSPDTRVSTMTNVQGFIQPPSGAGSTASLAGNTTTASFGPSLNSSPWDLFGIPFFIPGLAPYTPALPAQGGANAANSGALGSIVGQLWSPVMRVLIVLVGAVFIITGLVVLSHSAQGHLDQSEDRQPAQKPPGESVAKDAALVAA